jgi:hypothetical protein
MVPHAANFAGLRLDGEGRERGKRRRYDDGKPHFPAAFPSPASKPARIFIVAMSICIIDGDYTKRAARLKARTAPTSESGSCTIK